jgi:hypothetical protein
MSWKKIEVEKPIAFESGNWDGKRSNFVLTASKDGNYSIARMYEGFMDGSHFCDFYDERDYEVENVEYWMPIPELF